MLEKCPQKSEGGIFECFLQTVGLAAKPNENEGRDKSETCQRPTPATSGSSRFAPLHHPEEGREQTVRLLPRGLVRRAEAEAHTLIMSPSGSLLYTASLAREPWGLPPPLQFLTHVNWKNNGS